MTTPWSARGSLLRVGRLVVVAAMAMGFAAASPMAVQAECNPEGVPPSLEEAVTGARRIVIGDVVEVHPGGEWDPVEGRSSRFTLAVGAVVRGQAPRIMSIDDVTIRPCVGLIVVQQGDRVALMLDADEPPDPFRKPGSTMLPATFNAVAWIVGQPPDNVAFERVTGAELLSLAGLDASGALTETGVSPGFVLAFGALAVIIVAIAGWRRLGRTTD